MFCFEKFKLLSLVNCWKVTDLYFGEQSLRKENLDEENLSMNEPLKLLKLVLIY